MIEKIGNFNFFCLLFLSMMLMHLVCDFNLHGILAEMKQKRWCRLYGLRRDHNKARRLKEELDSNAY